MRISKRLSQSSNNNLHRWLVSYADYMTLMFALFVVLYALAIMKQEDFRVLSDSLGQFFELRGKQQKAATGNGELTNQVIQSDTKEGNDILPEQGPELTENELSIKKFDQPKLGNPLQALEHDLQSSLSDLFRNKVAELQRDEDWLTIELSSGLLFPSGSATHNPSTEVVIEQVAKTLMQADNFVVVRGYTDDVPIQTEIFASNWQLSAARAASITNLLQDFGVVSGRLTIEANGSNKPKVTNLTSQGRAQNRRVVIAISKYAYVEETNSAGIVGNLQQEPQTSGNLDSELPEYDDIRVIRLPNGEIRITTRQETTDKELQSESINNNN